MIDKDLKIYDSVCTGCSACTEACAFPDDNDINPIELILNEKGLAVPRINLDTCTTCMACYKACPTEDKIFNNDVTFESYKEKIGESYYGYSLDEEHRYEAATAGITTEIATYMLDTQQVDGVVSSYQNDDNQIITEIFTDSQEIKKSRGSIYRQVSLLNGLAEKIETGSFKKLLVIGLPCHIAGLKTLQKANKHLRKNVEFTTIALFCKQTKTEEFSNYERSILKAKHNQKIEYRGKGWPGVTRIEGSASLPSNHIDFSLMWNTFAFTPDYCFTCSDPIGVEADISIGDAWLKKYYSDKLGSSLIVTNTKIGKSIIQEMAEAKKIHIEKESTENIIASQGTNHIKFKTSHIKERNRSFSTELEHHDNDVPIQYQILIKWIKFNKSLYEKSVRWKIVRYIPTIFLKIYRRANVVIFSKLGKII